MLQEVSKGQILEHVSKVEESSRSLDIHSMAVCYTIIRAAVVVLCYVLLYRWPLLLCVCWFLCASLWAGLGE